MRVLNVVGTLRLGGGIETALLRTFRAIDRRDVALEFCHVGRLPTTLADDAERLGIPVWHCTESLNPFAFMSRLRRELRARRAYDVVHTHNSHFGGPVLSVARRLGVPKRLAQYHNLTSGHRNDWKRRLYESWLRRQVLVAATSLIAITHAGLRLWFPDVPESDPRKRVVRYGINIEEFSGPSARGDVRREFNIPAAAPLIGHIGRFVWQKNHARLIDAARLIVDRQPHTYLMLVGDGDLRPQIEAQVDRLRLRPRVVFTGVRRDVPRLLSAMDALVFPSLVEGFGYCQLEAQAAGVPVVASNIPTAVEAVAPVFREYLRPPEDTPGLADALLQLLARVMSGADASEQRAVLARQAREFASEFTIDASAAAMLAAWNA